MKEKLKDEDVGPYIDAAYTKFLEKKEYKSGALKHLDGKLRVDLIPPEMIEALATVLGYGTVKYADRNWEKGIPAMTIYGSAMRHLLAWAKGIDLDEESGEPHLYHAMCNIGMLATQYARKRDDIDDRPNKGQDND